MADFTACFMCYLPQAICRRADPEAEEELGSGAGADGCWYRDMIMPLCVGAFMAPGPRALIQSYFSRRYRNMDEYMRWLGEESEIGGAVCVQAVRVSAVLLSEFVQ